ncbi:hypothetical protein HPB50_027753 [Hyalomma asiaticum]|nr:hypothetical protein HPB50_027753 [Hyalomma asiaticum]
MPRSSPKPHLTFPLLLQNRNRCEPLQSRLPRDDTSWVPSSKTRVPAAFPSKQGGLHYGEASGRRAGTPGGMKHRLAEMSPTGQRDAVGLDILRK